MADKRMSKHKRAFEYLREIANFEMALIRLATLKTFAWSALKISETTNCEIVRIQAAFTTDFLLRRKTPLTFSECIWQN